MTFQTKILSILMLVAPAAGASFGMNSLGVDCNGNGISDDEDISCGSCQDCDLNGVPDECDPDCDGNGTPDECDLVLNPFSDCDSNGLIDSCEIALDATLDCNGNAALDTCDVAGAASLDCDTNGLIDSCEILADPTLDCDGNAVLDTCDLAGAPSLDCDTNGVIDSCEILADPTLDLDGNSVLDTCECTTGIFKVYCPISANSVGDGARIGNEGTASIAANDLTLTATGAPPSVFGLFFYGADRTQTPFGEGLMCVAPEIQRLQPVLLTDGSGATSLSLDLTAFPFDAGPFAISPYETWNFQFWYRDIDGGPDGFNLSDGLSVSFCP